MRNPFRSEEAAFRFLWLTIAYFGLIAIASADQHLGRARGVPARHGCDRHLVADVAWDAREEGQAGAGAAPRRRVAGARGRQRDGRRERAPRRAEAAGRGREGGGARRDAGAEHAAEALGLRRGRGPRRRGRAARGLARGDAGGRDSTRAARSATATRCRRSKMRSAPSRPTSSSSRRIRRAARTGSSGTWSRAPASASTSPSRTSSSISRPRATRPDALVPTPPCRCCWWRMVSFLTTHFGTPAQSAT